MYFRVDDDAADGGRLTTAYLIIRNADGDELARLDLLTLGEQEGPITLSPGSGLRLDLYLDVSTTGTVTSVTFKVGVYVTQESNEPPSL